MYKHLLSQLGNLLQVREILCNRHTAATLASLGGKNWSEWKSYPFRSCVQCFI